MSSIRTSSIAHWKARDQLPKVLSRKQANLGSFCYFCGSGTKVELVIVLDMSHLSHRKICKQN